MDLFLTALTESVKLCGDFSVILFIFLGVIWGAIAGALPGVGPSLAVGVVLPFTFGMSPVDAIVFLCTINCACSYGNSVPAILVGIPGTASAVLTAIDGYALHKKGKSGLALGVTYYAGMVGQFLGFFFFLAMVVPLSGLMFVFLSPEMAALYFLGCTAIVSITGDNIIKGLAAAAFGFAIGMIGRDPLSQVPRFAYLPELRSGVAVTPVIMGLLAVSEIFRQMRQSFNWDALVESFSAKFPSLNALKQVTPAVIVGSCIGQIVGAIPGIGGNVAAIIAYQQSKIWSKHPEEYGHGSIEGIASNEAAQNASQAGEMVPTFGLGIPGSGTMVLLFGALLMHGFLPGPMLIRQAPELLYASGAALIGTFFMLLIVGWPFAKILLRVVQLDRTLILVGALILTLIGTYSLNRSAFEVFLMVVFGAIGYFMLRYGYSTAGAAIALILGTGLETNLRMGLVLCNRDWWTFVTRPWTAVILIMAFGILVNGAIGSVRLARKAAALRRKAIAAHLSSGSVG